METTYFQAQPLLKSNFILLPPEILVDLKTPS